MVHYQERAGIALEEFVAGRSQPRDCQGREGFFAASLNRRAAPVL